MKKDLTVIGSAMLTWFIILIVFPLNPYIEIPTSLIGVWSILVMSIVLLVLGVVSEKKGS